jgi:hypothetical protein
VIYDVYYFNTGPSKNYYKYSLYYNKTSLGAKMKIKDFSPQSYTGLSNRKQLSKLSNEYRLAFFILLLAFYLFLQALMAALWAAYI